MWVQCLPPSLHSKRVSGSIPGSAGSLLHGLPLATVMPHRCEYEGEWMSVFMDVDAKV